MTDLRSDDETNEQDETDSTELFVQEDLDILDDEGDDEPDALEAKIAEEHVKFKESQAQYHQSVRAARPWSAPPLGSPRPEKVALRQQETAAALETLRKSPSSSNFDYSSERTEYVPPERPQVERAAAKGGSPLKYMAPPRPLSADTIRSAHRSSYSSSSKSAILQDIPEGGVLMDDKAVAAVSASLSSVAETPGSNADGDTTYDDNTGSPFVSESCIPTPPALPMACKTDEVDQDDEIYSDDDYDDDESDVMSSLSNLDSLLSQKLQAPLVLTNPCPQAGSGGVWVVQANADPEDSQEDGILSETKLEKAKDDYCMPIDEDFKINAQNFLAKTALSDSSPQSSEAPLDVFPAPLATSYPIPQAATVLHVVPTCLNVPSILDHVPLSPAASGTSPDNFSKQPSINLSQHLVRPSTAPPSRSSFKASYEPLLNLDEDHYAATDHAASDNNDRLKLLNPHDFSLQLLAHDLRILPAYQAAEVASAERISQRRLASGLNQARPSSEASKKITRPQSAVLPQRLSSQQPRTGQQLQQRSVPSVRRMTFDNNGGTEDMMQVCRALRSSPSSRDRMTALPAALPSYTSLGRQRPSSARPSFSVYTADQNRSALAPPESVWTGPFGNNALPRRPMSAQPAYGRTPISLLDSDIHGRGLVGPTNLMANTRTAAIDVSGQSVSVYVAETMKRIAEANRYLAEIGSARRYQLEDPNNNMIILLVKQNDNRQQPLPDDDIAYDRMGDSIWSSPAAVLPERTVVKALKLRKFLTDLARLKSQVAAHRIQAADHSSRPLPPKYDVYEVNAEPMLGDAGTVQLTQNDVEENIVSATQQCEDLALQVHLLCHAQLAL